MGTKASQMMQVVYIVNPMCLLSLKASGILRVSTAYTVHTTMRPVWIRESVKLLGGVRREHVGVARRAEW